MSLLGRIALASMLVLVISNQFTIMEHMEIYSADTVESVETIVYPLFMAAIAILGHQYDEDRLIERIKEELDEQQTSD